ncbi:hypothetical protein BELL_1347g00010 [Botrytis elliptica]|uniref:DUF7371 domain-containing protein n=1 Tax=Botrytis elliptica TaxID=278938 RepID=A0A4Z1IL25_9HELO|nr:hypothetical protein BELL_1347g00010 [Botrytis elliptica]
MILNFLIAIWAICGTAVAAPQYGPIESTVTVYAPCSETPAPFPTAVASNRMAQIIADTSLPPFFATTFSTYSSVGFSESTRTIEASQPSRFTGSIETAAGVRQIPQSSSDVFSFIVVEGTTSWLNGQTPTSAPSQSFVVITSAITVVPVSIPPPPASTSVSSSEVLVISTETVIPLPTTPSPASSSSYSLTKSSSSESVIISTETVIPLSTLPLTPSSSMTTETKSTSTDEPVILSTKASTPLPTTSQSSSPITIQPAPSSNVVITLTTTKTTVVPLSTLPSTTTASSKSTFTSASAIISSQSSTNYASPNGTIISSTSTFASVTLPTAVVSTSTISFNLSSMASNLSTTANPLSSLSSVPSLTISRPDVSESSIKPVTPLTYTTPVPASWTTTPLPSGSPSEVLSSGGNSTGIWTVASAPSTILPIFIEPSPSLTASSSFKPASSLATHTVFSPTSVVSQSASGRIFTGIASNSGGWNSTSQTAAESTFNTPTLLTTGSLTTLTGVRESQVATQTFNSVFATSTTSDSSFSMPTSISSSNSLSKDTSLSTYTPTSSSTSTSGFTSIPSFNATFYTSSFSLPTSISSSNSLSKDTSLSTYTPTSSSDSTPSFTLTSGFNVTSYASSLSKSTSSSILIPVINATSTFQSSSLSTTASTSTFIPVIEGSSSVTFPNSTSSTSTSIISSATPTNCGERGDFVLIFDDVPPSSVSNASDTDVQPEPLFNPYHQFLFSDGFTVIPPPKRLPFLPSSKPLLLEFTPNFQANSSDRKTGPNTADHSFSGQIGSGDERHTGCFNFNLYGASLGCDSTGPSCDFTFTGYKYDEASQQTSQVTQQIIHVPACPELANCVLTTVDLEPSFRDLTHFVMNATVAGEPKLWWMDDLRLGWSDNSCAMGLCRQNAHVR